LESLNDVFKDGKYLSLVADMNDAITREARAELEIVSLESGSTTPVRPQALDPRFGTGRALNPRVQLPPGGNSLVYVINENGVDNLWAPPTEKYLDIKMLTLDRDIVVPLEGFDWKTGAPEQR
jgi:hypothetical protein